MGPAPGRRGRQAQAVVKAASLLRPGHLAHPVGWRRQWWEEVQLSPPRRITAQGVGVLKQGHAVWAEEFYPFQETAPGMLLSLIEVLD